MAIFNGLLMKLYSLERSRRRDGKVTRCAVCSGEDVPGGWNTFGVQRNGWFPNVSPCLSLKTCRYSRYRWSKPSTGHTLDFRWWTFHILFKESFGLPGLPPVFFFAPRFPVNVRIHWPNGYELLGYNYGYDYVYMRMFKNMSGNLTWFAGKSFSPSFSSMMLSLSPSCHHFCWWSHHFVHAKKLPLSSISSCLNHGFHQVFWWLNLWILNQWNHVLMVKSVKSTWSIAKSWWKSPFEPRLFFTEDFHHGLFRSRWRLSPAKWPS